MVLSILPERMAGQKRPNVSLDSKLVPMHILNTKGFTRLLQNNQKSYQIVDCWTNLISI